MPCTRKNSGFSVRMQMVMVSALKFLDLRLSKGYQNHTRGTWEALLCSLLKKYESKCNNEFIRNTSKASVYSIIVTHDRIFFLV